MTVMTDQPLSMPDHRPSDQRRPIAQRDRRLAKFLAQPLILEESGPPRALTQLLLAASLLIGGFIAWAAVTEVQETALANGQVVPAGSVHAVQHLEGGIIAAILVEEGQVVEAGQPLIRLQEAAPLAERDQLRVREAALSLRAERLRAFVLGNEPDFSSARAYADMVSDQTVILQMQMAARDSQRAVLLSRVEQRKAEVASYAGKRKNLEEQVAIIRRQHALQQDLVDKKLFSQMQFFETERALSQALGDLSALDSELTASREALAEAQNSLLELEANLGNDAITEMGEVDSELAQVREQVVKLEDRVDRLVIAAPARGIVKGLVTQTIGAVIAPGEPLLEIVPIEDEMVAEVRIHPRDVGHLRVGQPAQVKLTTYDVARHGAIEGQLSRISASTFQDEEGQPFYKATIKLAKNYVGQDAARNPALPGMVVDADIRTGSKSLLRYLLKPVYRSLDVAFRER
jgi:HlyD family secretion protein/adhesin transport system membrane fusion protein